MRYYETDLKALKNLFANGKSEGNLSKLYEHTNEHLTEILSDFDFKEKDVLSVMASADQPFSLYYLGAKSVDTFDNNLATYYLFYLRKWYLLYYKKAFMDIHEQTLLDTKSKELMKSLIMANPNSDEEMNVKRIWQTILENDFNILNGFYSNLIENFSVPYLGDLDLLIDIVKDKTANFYELDVFENVDLKKKYDFIILSNILEYEHMYNPINSKLRDNLDNLLKEDGIVICTVLNDLYFEIQLSQKRLEMEKTFKKTLSDKKVYDRKARSYMPIYYTYMRK